MPSHVRPLITAPRLNYRQSTIMTTPVEKTSLPNSGMEAVEPYYAAQPLERPMVTNDLSGSRKDDTDDTSVGGLSSASKDPESLLLKKATSKSSMNLASLLDNCGTLRQDDIIPRSTKSEPFATTLPSQQQEQEDYWNEQHCDHDKKDNIDQDDEEWVNDSKWNNLQTRLLNIITTTIHQELERHYQSTVDDAASEQHRHQHPMTTETNDTLSKNDRSTTYSTGALSPLSVPQWLQQGHVALEKMIAAQHEERTKAMGLLEQRIHVLEQQQHQQQEHQQQTQICQKKDAQDEKTIYNALHVRYMDLVTQHSHQLEKYQQLEQIHLSQSLALKQHHQRTPHPLTNHEIPTTLPSPKQPPINNQQIMNHGYPHKHNKDINTATPLDQQTHHTYRYEHHDMVSAPLLEHHHHHHHHHPNLATDTQNPKSYHLQYQQSTMLPTPTASPTTELASPTHSPADFIPAPAPPAGRHSILPPPPQQQNQSVKLDNGYVEFMTECNGQHVLCRVKLPKDADADKVANSTNKNKNTKTMPNPPAQTRRGHPNNRHQSHYQNNHSKNSKARGQHAIQQRYQQQAQQKHHSHHIRPQQKQHEYQQPRYHLEHQPSPQQQLHHHHHHYRHQYQHQQYQHQQYQKHRHATYTSYVIQ